MWKITVCFSLTIKIGLNASGLNDYVIIINIISLESYYTEIPATKAILDLPGEPGIYFCMKTYIIYHLYCGKSRC